MHRAYLAQLETCTRWHELAAAATALPATPLEEATALQQALERLRDGPRCAEMRRDAPR